MIACQELYAISPHILLSCKHIFGVHPEGNVGSLLGSHLFQGRDLRFIEQRFNPFLLCRHHVLNLVVVGDAAVLPGQHAAALVGGQFTRMSDHYVEDVSGDAQIAHETA